MGSSDWPSPPTRVGQPEPWSAGRADQLERLVAALQYALGDLPDAARVVLLLELRLGRAPLDRHEYPPERARRNRQARSPPEHPRLVERLTGREELLAIDLTAPRVAPH